MSEQITCPQCERPMAVPDHVVGKKIKCTRCEHTFVAVARTITPAVADSGHEYGLVQNDNELQETQESSELGTARFRFACPSCRARFNGSTRLIGKTFKCKKCSHGFEVREPKAFVQERLREEKVSRADRHREPVAKEVELTRGWEVARQGLNLVYLGGLVVTYSLACLMVVVLPLLVVALTIAYRPGFGYGLTGVFALLMCVMGIRLRAADSSLWSIPFTSAGLLILLIIPYVAIVVLIVGFIVMGVAGLVALIGHIFCVMVPWESAVKPFAIGGALCIGAAITSYVLMVIAIVANPAMASHSTYVQTSLLAMTLFAAAGHLMFVTMLMGLARFFGDRPSVEYIRSFLLYQSAYYALSVSVETAVRLKWVSDVGFVASIGIFLGVFSIVNAFWFLQCVAAARDIIRSTAKSTYE